MGQFELDPSSRNRYLKLPVSASWGDLVAQNNDEHQKDSSVSNFVTTLSAISEEAVGEFGGFS